MQTAEGKCIVRRLNTTAWGENNAIRACVELNLEGASYMKRCINLENSTNSRILPRTLTQWPTNCCSRWYKGMLSRPVDTWLSPQRQPALLTAAFAWGARCLWRILQWDLVVITGPLVLSVMLSNQHSHYWVTWHLLPDKASLFPPTLPLWMNASLILFASLTEWSTAFIWLAWDNNNKGMCSMSVCVCACVGGGGKQPWVRKFVSE